MIQFDEEQNIYIADEVIFKPATHLAPNIYTSRDGRYIRFGTTEVRSGTQTRDKDGRKLAAIVSIGRYTTKKGTRATLTRNIGSLVLDAWTGIDPDRKEVDHIDRDPYNNSLSNLRWCNRSEQMLNTRYKYHEECLAIDPNYDRLDSEERKAVRRKVYHIKYDTPKKREAKRKRYRDRRMRKKAALGSFADQPSNYTDSSKQAQSEALLIQSEGDNR